VAMIRGESDADVFEGVDAKRLAEDFVRPLRRLASRMRATFDGRVRWTMIPWPTEAWARQVYPDLPAAAAKRELARDLLRFCRLTQEDGADGAGWRDHLARLGRRAQRLTELDLRAVEYRAPNVHLDVTLAQGTVFLGGSERNAYGQLIAANMPTEEVFTSPLAGRADGTFRASRPLVTHGRVIEGIEAEFRSGRLARLECASGDDRDFLSSVLAADRGASRLGEVAFVDSSSRIGRAGRLYWNTLIDENATAHVAFGAGFEATRAGDGASGRRGVNGSSVHLDVMIGSPELEVTAVTASGRRIPLLAGEEWQLPL
jgi:aminopeptidase